MLKVNVIAGLLVAAILGRVVNLHELQIKQPNPKQHCLHEVPWHKHVLCDRWLGHQPPDDGHGAL